VEEINRTSTSHVATINFLSDYLPEERKLLCGLQLSPPDLTSWKLFEPRDDPPTTIDWRVLGKVNQIKD
jgi:hypothetical protein